jgi:glucans biosynthesis protein
MFDSVFNVLNKTKNHFYCLGFSLFLACGHAQGFSFEDVSAKAKRLAEATYIKPEKELPASLSGLGYDQYRDIRFKNDLSPWHRSKTGFDLAFFHPGHFFNVPVRIHEVVNNQVKEFRFDPRLFDYGKNVIKPKDLSNLNFAGFRIHYPINTAKYKDEVLVFLGASYFRAVGKNQRYGLSARGLAIDTALSSGEEFPQFTEFWIARPQPKDKHLVIYALLNSKRVTGAYQFILRPGTDTVMDVKAQLHFREHVSKLGIAPLTSMYFFGENQRSQVEDYRPEVHDSDGLSIQSGTGEWLWRPLVNPKRLLVTSYALSNPFGFGLMQRDRYFKSYEDLESHYERRPSLWVEPKGKWGNGRVELVQIPTPDETNDNIVAFWSPESSQRPGVPFDIEYTLSWQKDTEKRPPASWVVQTRRGHGWRHTHDDTIALTVDFEGPGLKKLASDEKIQAFAHSETNGKIVEVNAIRNDMTGGWRMTVRLRRVDEKKPVELRGYLKLNNDTLSETWSYILPPD